MALYFCSIRAIKVNRVTQALKESKDTRYVSVIDQFWYIKIPTWLWGLGE